MAFNLILEFFSYNLAIFFFKSDKGIDGANKLFLLFIFQLDNFLFNLSSLIITIVHNVFATCLQQCNYLSIIEGEYDFSNLNFSNIDAAFFFMLVVTTLNPLLLLLI